jgi:hypothetical protein
MILYVDFVVESVTMEHVTPPLPHWYFGPPSAFLTTHLHLMPRPQMAELYLNSPI